MPFVGEWNPNSDRERAKLVNTSQAPYETPAVLRLFRAGVRGNDLCKAVNMHPSVTIKAVRKALDGETEASRCGRVIHDATVPRGTV